MHHEYAQRWNNAYDRLLAYRRAHPDSWPSQSYVAPDGTRLGRWCDNQRTLWRRDALNPARKRKLDALGFQWEPIDNQWQRAFRELARFRRQHPKLWPTARFVTPSGVKLGMWCAIQRHRRKQGMISRERIATLDRMGFPWNLSTDIWDKAYPALQAFRIAHPDSWPTRKHVTREGIKLGYWWNGVRGRARRGQVPRERMGALEKLGFQLWR